MSLPDPLTTPLGFVMLAMMNLVYAAIGFVTAPRMTQIPHLLIGVTVGFSLAMGVTHLILAYVKWTKRPDEIRELEERLNV